MEYIYRKHMAIKPGKYLFSAQLMGGGVFCGFFILAVRLNYFQLSRRGFDLLGLTRRRNKYIPLKVRWKRAWGKRNE